MSGDKLITGLVERSVFRFQLYMELTGKTVKKSQFEQVTI